MASIFHLGLSKDFSLILDDADDYNVIIQVGENQNMKEFRAHSVILRARSSYFKGALSSNWVTKKDNMIIFSKPNLTPTIFDMILRYIYTGELDLTKQSGENILGLLVASDELLLEELFEHVQDYLIKKQNIWVRQNFVLVLNTVFRLVSCKNLQDYCFESICEDPLPFITSKSFLSLDKDSLFNLLESDNLQIEEVKVWDYLIKWGIEQTSAGLGSSSNSDRTNWDNDNYDSLKQILNQFIPLIRFVGISHKDLFNKVYPYKAIIPSHIFKEIEEFYYNSISPSLPIRIRKIKSNIINLELVNPIIENWIVKKNSKNPRTGNDLLYRFKPIYRSIRDGISDYSFRNKCNGRVASLVLVKVENTSKIFGGYSSIGFSSLGYNFNNVHSLKFYDSSDNFIFSFEDSEDTQNMKISRVVNKSRAILDCYSGFNFGQGSLVMDNEKLFVNYNACQNYENNLNIEAATYTIKEIETFIEDR
ncbi:uncharacterized protein OCT59_012308 [Rhizophagus irregularis]|uniref:Serine-enriched protein n=2 Tax=Rhizophagus irregularis TaxID=588596 RepID=A0A015JM53_RHIIW|nr:hypothetical protein GLOIN_2v1470539 [Rhizophagus irregularis DAOM 181602=DAOM 197198]EXX68275.1 hypothetical protein RirG_106630 [Rhizophagus irregularis DAOM 197198w]POG81706.1 hypothetical protein GLOIN_2v1470539 [Rhizophagus irregularis DAOM 181602=DAOM 197198]UZO01204.1 hypothetical protein OCT59_012308 [Rhizophagus irregularis]|eukprot:XP_025188572.1 hypothetical protein GLOIN_2v1470539 [Rhizophagus irregularis DAOM 181602=DAOM 197198]